MENEVNQKTKCEEMRKKGLSFSCEMFMLSAILMRDTRTICQSVKERERNESVSLFFSHEIFRLTLYFCTVLTIWHIPKRQLPNVGTTDEVSRISPWGIL